MAECRRRTLCSAELHCQVHGKMVFRERRQQCQRAGGDQQRPRMLVKDLDVCNYRGSGAKSSVASSAGKCHTMIADLRLGPLTTATSALDQLAHIDRPGSVDLQTLAGLCVLIESTLKRLLFTRRRLTSSLSTKSHIHVYCSRIHPLHLIQLRS